ncbi:MAG: alpha/beta fold hydrolase [Pseudomonadota bacterium]
MTVLSWLWVPVCFAAAGALWTRYAEAREAKRSVPPGRFVTIAGRQLHVNQRGSGGPAVVIESGGAASSVKWWPILDRLAAHTTVLTYDRAGLGWSDPAPLPRSIEDRAEELARVLEQSGVPAPYVLVGLSYGGPIIRVFAARYSERVAGLVFVDSAHESVFHRPAAQAYLRRSARLLRVAGLLARLGALRAFRLRGIPTAPTALPFSDAELRLLQGRFPPVHTFATGADEFRSMQDISQAMSGLDAPGALRRKPIVVISHGLPFPGPFAVLEEGHLEGQQALAALSAQGTLVVARQSSHAVPLQEPEVVIEEILRVVHSAQEMILGATASA